ncbi:hypothetical protein [Aestuariibacter salexigens]|nr:hypothetical protein [Aestuariibacter salexigens]
MEGLRETVLSRALRASLPLFNFSPGKIVEPEELLTPKRQV